MTAFDEAVRHDLAAAPQPASLDRLRRLVRRRRSRKMISGAVALLVVAIGATLLVAPTHHSSTVTVQPSTSPTSAPAPSSTGRVTPCPLALQPAGGQQVVPVAVPCDCPTAPITVPPAGADERADAARAALAWVSRVKHWAPKAGRVTAIYKVGDTSRGVWGVVFAQSVPKFCGKAVSTASWVIELGNDQIDNTGRQAAVAVAHFAVGWQVWGVYA
jgi:hypothetical protein